MSIDFFNAIPGSGMFSLSPAQHRLWVASALAEHSSAYHSTRAWKIIGVLNIDALERALSYVVNRNPALRTQFIDTAFGPRQIIVSAHDFLLQRGKILQEAGECTFISDALRAEASRRFDLTRSLPIRAQIFALGEDRYLFLLSVHHLVFDGTAIGLILDDLANAYSVVVGGRAFMMDSEPDRQSEYLAKLMALGQNSATSVNSEYWRSKLSGLPSLLNLPLDRPRTEQLEGKGGWQQLVIDEATTAKLFELTYSTNSSIFTVVTAVIMSLIYRYTGEPDVCIGYPVSNRDVKGYENWVGCMVNTLPLRVVFPPKFPFSSLIHVTRALVIEGKLHSTYLIDDILIESRNDFRDGRSPLSQVIVNENSNYEPALSLADLVIDPLPRETDEAPSELAWLITCKRPSLSIRLEYNRDLFDRSTIERMVGHFKTLLEAVVTNPDCLVRDLPLLTEAERHQILVEWNDTKAEFPQDKCIHQLFEEQAERTPEAVAVVFEDQQLTYRELNAKANQLAHHLGSLGVKPDTLVAICVERSLEMVVGLLGILKAGGAYVPLDPDYPEERLAFMLQDTAAAVLVTQAQLRERVPQTGTRAVCIDSDWGEIGSFPATNPQTVTSPLNLAYCIYTSGSTGRPKGVLISHSSLVNLIFDWMRSEPAAPTSRFSLWTSIAFDVSAWEWLTPLAQGASLAIPTEDCRMDPATFLRWAEVTGVTTAYLAPHLARAVPSPSLAGASVPPTLLLGVEPLNERSLFGSLQSRVVNGYGPTEATVYASVYRQLLQPIDRNLPIGTPISNAKIYIIDGQLQPVSVGITGELHIAGAGLARGYLNLPDLTAEKFIPDPFGEPGSRMYKTGDLARYLPDGNIEFLGRMDHQVKIRGFRIELGEVESALQRCEGVREVVVLAREDEPGDKRLAAYVVPMSGAPAVSELRAQLLTFLPEYMVPTAWVFLDALPLNPNGKIDRMALPAPQAQLQVKTPPLQLPRQSASDPILDGVLEILQELMPTVTLSSKDDLFANGFHSVLLLRFVASCYKQFGVRVSLRDVYRNGTGEKIAELIRLATRPVKGAPE